MKDEIGTVGGCCMVGSGVVSLWLLFGLCHWILPRDFVWWAFPALVTIILGCALFWAALVVACEWAYRRLSPNGGAK